MLEVVAVPYALLADVIVAIHVAFVGYVILGQVAILIGVCARCEWARNLWFRCSHLLAILIVAFETLASINCPLTIWEADLRRAAGQAVTGETFIGRMLHSILFYDFPPWVFTTMYLSFALLVVATFVLAPPRRRPTRSSVPAQVAA
jgi:hypothetical protein